MAPVIVAEQLTKWYGPRLAVDRVSLEVEAGEVMGLLGPNGSGKTTILRILTGYLRPSAGTARIAGLDVVDDALAARSRVGYVPEDAALYGGMSVREFLVFMAKLKGLSGRAATEAFVLSFLVILILDFFMGLFLNSLHDRLLDCRGRELDSPPDYSVPGQVAVARTPSPSSGLGPPTAMMSSPSGPASNARTTSGATRMTSQVRSSWVSSSSRIRPEPATTT